VWAVFAVQLVLAVRFVLVTAHDVPIVDQWTLVGVLSGQRPLDLEWLWTPQDDHRLPLPKILQVVLFRCTGDFRASIWLNLGLSAALAAIGIVTARRLRGRTSWVDAVFPLALLDLGHWGLLSGFEIVFVLPVFLFGSAVAIAARLGEGARGRREAALAACLVPMPLCGFQGLVLAVPLAVLAGTLAVRRRARAAIALAGVVLVTSAAVFVGWAPEPTHPPLGGVAAAARAALQFTSAGMGLAGARFWPWSAVLFVALSVGTVAALARAARTPGPHRANQVALGIAFLAFGALAGAVGLGRGGWGEEAGLAPRYASLAVLLPFLVAIAWSRLGAVPGARIVGAILLAVLCIAATFDYGEGMRRGRMRSRWATQFERDAWTGARDLAPNGPHPTPRPILFTVAREARLPPWHLSEAERDRRLAPFYRSLKALGSTPDRIRSVRSIRSLRCHGERAVLVAAPGRVVWNRRPGAHRLTGRVGLCEDLGAPARFVARAGGRVVFDRVLRPQEREEDRGLVALDASFEADDLVLETLAVGTKDPPRSVIAGIEID
jgi:hypothetical protein